MANHARTPEMSVGYGPATAGGGGAGRTVLVIAAGACAIASIVMTGGFYLARRRGRGAAPAAGAAPVEVNAGRELRGLVVAAAAQFLDAEVALTFDGKRFAT